MFTLNMKKPTTTEISFAIAYIAIRISLANKAPITDCDEVYNYWEPLHFLLHGSGMQTWEYAPQYALRTYAYLFPMAILNRLYNLLQIPKVQAFAMLRCTLAAITAISELRIAHALLPYSISSPSLSIWTLVILLTSAGMFHSAPAYLPSATAMICVMNSVACQLNSAAPNLSNAATQHSSRKWDGAILWGLVAILMTGWPFCAVLFIPLGFYAIWDSFTSMNNGNGGAPSSHEVVHLMGRVIIYAVAIQTIVMVIDYQYYGKIISPTFNIFVYNTGLFSKDGINRDELYGVEDVSYYIKNLFLNWNGIALMGILALPLRILFRIAGVIRREGSSKSSIGWCSWILDLVCVPTYLWMGIVFSRPHKEERFLFPIYPLLAIGGAVSMELFFETSKLHSWIIRMCRTKKKIDNQKAAENSNLPTIKIFMGLIFLLPFVLISITRSLAITDGYLAPLALYRKLYKVLDAELGRSDNLSKSPLVCTGGEWYRFPSSYHLPGNTKFAFLKSSFDGQLPQQFTKYGSKEESLSVQKGVFNDLNEDALDRYVDVEDCQFIIELIESSNSHQTHNDKYLDDNKWKELSRFNFLDAENTTILHRVLYIPLLRQATYKSYVLFERREEK